MKTNTTRILASSSSKSLLFRHFQHYAMHHPVISNSILCLGLWTAGDLVAQYSEHEPLQQQKDNESASSPSTPATTTTQSTAIKLWNKVDWTRTAQCAAYGAVVTGPFLAVWYPYLERVCIRYQIAARYGIWGPPVAKVFAENVIVDPPSMALYFGYMTVCENAKDGDDGVPSSSIQSSFQHKIKTQLLPCWMTGLTFWPPVLLASFRFLPVYAQAPFINVCFLFWDGFLSHRNSLSKHHDQQAQEVRREDSGRNPRHASSQGDEGGYHLTALESHRIKEWEDRIRRRLASF